MDAGELREAVALANVPVLLLLLVQMTGDPRWLQDPYRPSRNEGLGDNATGGLPEEIQAEVREAALAAIEAWRAGRPLALPAPDGDQLVEMLSISMGEPVAPEYGAMIQAELGIESSRVDGGPSVAGLSAGDASAGDSLRDSADAVAAPPGFHVVVIGAGVSGIAAAVMLERAGIPYEVLERDSGVGGTWLANRYPGCGVDTPSPIYSYSFAAHPWSRYFAGRDEVLGYLQDVAAEAGIPDHISFGADVRSAEYLATQQRWRVTVVDQDRHERIIEPNVVISAVGAFNAPKMPDIPGLEQFHGDIIHTARWPEREVSLEGRQVGVIGTGASAMQVVPALAPQVDRLTVFQRSPQWVAPFPYHQAEIPEVVRRLGEEVPLYRQWYRIRWSWTFNDRLHPALQKDPDWEHPERAVSAENDIHRSYFTKYLTRRLADRPDLQEKATPDYPPFGKRILLDNGWFSAIVRDNVDLVTDPIARVEADGVILESGERVPLDLLVCATGFDVVRFLSTIRVQGRSGRVLEEFWDGDNARAYLGTAVPGFPNFFILYGPNVQPGHGGSLVGLAEMQATYVVSLLRRMFADGIGTLECREDVWEEYNATVDAAHERMVWTHPGMATYYRNARGRVVVPGPFRVIDLWHRLHDSGLSDYESEPAVEHAD